jgi:hypothetical protein
VRISTLIVAIPAALAAVWIAVANRGPVTLSLDPFAAAQPALAVEMPLYLLLFLCVLLGVLLAGLAVALRHAARRSAEIAGAAQARAAALLPSALRKPKTPPP